MTTEETLLARIDERVQQISKELESLREDISDSYVELSRFAPVEKLAYGLVSAILLGAIAAIWPYK